MAVEGTLASSIPVRMVREKVTLYSYGRETHITTPTMTLPLSGVFLAIFQQVIVAGGCILHPLLDG